MNLSIVRGIKATREEFLETNYSYKKVLRFIFDVDQLDHQIA